MSDNGYSNGESDIDDNYSSDGHTDIDDEETKRIMDEIDEDKGYSIDAHRRSSFPLQEPAHLSSADDQPPRAAPSSASQPSSHSLARAARLQYITQGFDMLIEYGIPFSRHRPAASPTLHNAPVTPSPAVSVGNGPSQLGRLHIPPNQTPRRWSRNVGHKPSRHNDDLYSWAPPKELDIESLLGSYQLSIEELITFLPLHSTWTAWWHRCAKGEWGQTDVAKLMVASRRLPNEDKAGMDERYDKLSNRCHYSKRVAMGAEARAAVPASDSEPARAAQPARDAILPREHLLRIDDSVNDSDIDFTTSDWMHPCKDSKLVKDCPLLRLAHKVTRMPRGNGKGILTTAIENAKAKNHWSVMLSELAIYVAQEGLNVPEFRLPTSSGTLSDIAATDRAARDAFRIAYSNLT